MNKLWRVALAASLVLGTCLSAHAQVPKRISDLPTAPVAHSSDLFIVEQNYSGGSTGVTVNITEALLAQFLAGTGLSAANGSLSVRYGTTAGTAAAGNDSRLTPLTAEQLTALCNLATDVLSGCVPASGGGTTNFYRADGTFAPIAGSTGGTVTSVGLALPGIFSVSGSPVTGAGTLTGTLASETANRVLAAPDGSNGTPTFRALVGADLPEETSAIVFAAPTTLTVAAQTVTLPFVWTSGHIVAVEWYSATGSFTVAAQKNDTPVTGCSAINVNSASDTITPCTSTAAVKQDQISIAITAPVSSPNRSYVAVIVTHTVN